MSEEKIRRGHCPECGPDRNSDIVAEHQETYHDDEHGASGATDYRILKCRGCGAVYYQKATAFFDEVDYKHNPTTNESDPFLIERIEHWPAPTKRSEPTWIATLWHEHERLSDLLSDVYGALNADLRVPAAIAARTTFDAASEALGVDTAQSFQEKLKDLKASGHIGSGESDSLSILTDAGSAAAHRGWKPKPDQLDTIVSILEAFLHRAFVLKREAAELKEHILQKPPRRSKKCD